MAARFGRTLQTGGNGNTALKYLAPYIFRVAISNRRLVKLENDQVTFRYRTSDTGQPRLCTLPAEEFIHRFLQHILPKGFVKVRYYGFFAHGCRQCLAAPRQYIDQTCQSDNHPHQPDEDRPPSPTIPKGTLPCPICGKPMLPKQTIQPCDRLRSPPTAHCPS